MKVYQVLNLKAAIESIPQEKVKEYNSITAYLLARNIRNINKVAEKFNADRDAILKDEWFQEYQKEAKDDEVKANEKYKVQLSEASKEIETLLNAECEFEVYQRSIEEVNFDGEDVLKLYDLIKE